MMLFLAALLDLAKFFILFDLSNKLLYLLHFIFALADLPLDDRLLRYGLLLEPGQAQRPVHWEPVDVARLVLAVIGLTVYQFPYVRINPIKKRLVLRFEQVYIVNIVFDAVLVFEVVLEPLGQPLELELTKMDITSTFSCPQMMHLFSRFLLRPSMSSRCSGSYEGWVRLNPSMMIPKIIWSKKSLTTIL